MMGPENKHVRGDETSIEKSHKYNKSSANMQISLLLNRFTLNLLLVDRHKLQPLPKYGHGSFQMGPENKHV